MLLNEKKNLQEKDLQIQRSKWKLCICPQENKLETFISAIRAAFQGEAFLFDDFNSCLIEN